MSLDAAAKQAAVYGTRWLLRRITNHASMIECETKEVIGF